MKIMHYKRWQLLWLAQCNDGSSGTLQDSNGWTFIWKENPTCSAVLKIYTVQFHFGISGMPSVAPRSGQGWYYPKSAWRFYNNSCFKASILQKGERYRSAIFSQRDTTSLLSVLLTQLYFITFSKSPANSFICCPGIRLFGHRIGHFLSSVLTHLQIYSGVAGCCRLWPGDRFPTEASGWLDVTLGKIKKQLDENYGTSHNLRYGGWNGRQPGRGERGKNSDWVNKLSLNKGKA